MDAIRKFRERWRMRRDRIKRLNAARYADVNHEYDDYAQGGGSM